MKSLNSRQNTDKLVRTAKYEKQNMKDDSLRENYIYYTLIVSHVSSLFSRKSR